MMYEMLTMDMPLLPQNSSFGGWYQAHHNFKPEPFSSRLNLPEELQDLVFRCLAKERDRRPQSAREIMETLERIEQQSKFGASNSGLNINTVEHFAQNTLKTTNTTPTTTFSREATLNAIDHRTVNTETSVTEICLQTSWPEDKPLRKIVFSQIIDTPLGEVPVLCVMLEQDDVYQRINCTRYNQFLYLANPHPILLWITVLYNAEHGAKWLPCYLDLKSNKGQEIARTLANKGKYRILFYGLDEPQQCQHILSSIINPRNCKMLQEWANLSQVTKSLGDAKITKKILQQELEKLKDKILTKVKASKLTDVNAGE
jgi:serine/threonine-protein kinase